MEDMCMIFFGSTADSVIVLSKLFESTKQQSNESLVVAVVTQPPRPVGRNQIMTPTPVELWAKEHTIPSLSFPSDPQKPWLYESEDQVIDTLEPLKADLLVSACYGQKIPWEVIKEARFGGLNVHPSLLPRWRGADPVPWAILSGDRQTGVSVVTLSETFDSGEIIAQKKTPIVATDTSDALRTRLFEIGATLLVEVIPDFISQKRITKNELTNNESSYARRLTREDGFEPWEAIMKAYSDPSEAARIDRKFRAFTPWPGLWTLLRQGYGGQAREKRLKILDMSLVSGLLSLSLVQLEGKKPVSWKQFISAYPLFPT